MNLNIPVPPEEDFVVPSGKYRVQCTDAFERDEPFKDQTATSIRLKFRVLSLEHPWGEYVLGKTYPASLAQGSELRRDLDSWLGREKFLSLISDRTFNLKGLLGELGDAEVVQIPNDGYKNPFSHVKKLAPPGSLTGNSSRTCVNLATCIRNLPQNFNN